MPEEADGTPTSSREERCPLLFVVVVVVASAAAAALTPLFAEAPSSSSPFSTAATTTALRLVVVVVSIPVGVNICRGGRPNEVVGGTGFLGCEVGCVVAVVVAFLPISTSLSERFVFDGGFSDCFVVVVVVVVWEVDGAAVHRN